MSYNEAARMQARADQQTKEWQALCAAQMKQIEALTADNQALRLMCQQLMVMAKEHEEITAQALEIATRAQEVEK